MAYIKSHTHDIVCMHACVAVLLSPLNKREVLKTPYFPLLLYKRPSLIEGETSFHISVQSACIRYKWCLCQDDSLGGLSVRYRIWLEDSRGEECDSSAVSAE